MRIARQEIRRQDGQTLWNACRVGAVGLGEDGARLGAPVFAWWRFLHQAIGFSSPPPGRLAALAPATCPDHVSGEGRLGAMAVIGRVARGPVEAADRGHTPRGLDACTRKTQFR